jgi:hypothetical protein
MDLPRPVARGEAWLYEQLGFTPTNEMRFTGELRAP